MRLICPNCAAQYEVDDALVPSEGRDVQCSSCGHTWFQQRDTAEETLAEEMGVTVTETYDDDLSPPEADPIAPTPPPVAPPPQPRKIDPAARDILREEARREAEARRREKGGNLEIQPDLGLDETRSGENRAAAARARLNRLRNPNAEEPAETPTDAPAEADKITEDAPGNSSRRELLPDIEEINSTLTATSDRKSEEGEPSVELEEVAVQRRGFRIGFFSVFLILVVLGIIYVLSPKLSEMIPALTPALTSYVSWVNNMLDTGQNAIAQGAATLTNLLKGDGSS